MAPGAILGEEIDRNQRIDTRSVAGQDGLERIVEELKNVRKNDGRMIEEMRDDFSAM